VNFNIYAFWDICIWIIPLVIFFSTFITAIIGSFAKRSSYGVQIAIAFSYIFCIGVIVHEMAHQLMCHTFGVRVKELRYFRVEHKRTEDGEYLNIGGYVNFEDVNSLITGIFLGIAPLLVNGILVALICYYAPVFETTSYYPLFIYLGFALGIGARPSKEDLLLWYQALRMNPGRGLLEFLLLCFFGGIVYALFLVWQVDLWISFTIIFLFIVFFIFQGRPKAGRSPSNYLPRM